MNETMVQASQTNHYAQQIRSLYTKSLFLRNDEQEALRDSAKLLDKQAALLSVLELLAAGSGEETKRCNVKLFIAELRKWQRARKSDVEYLAQLRNEAIVFRRTQLKKSAISRWMSGLTGGSLSAQIAQLEDSLLKADINNSEFERKLALKLCIMMVLLNFHHKSHSAKNEPFPKIKAVLSYVNRLRWKRDLYTTLYRSAKYRSVEEGK